MIPVLETICQSVRKQVESLKSEIPEELLDLQRQAHDFPALFHGKGLHVISEIKFKSPSEGEIRSGDPVRIAQEYLNSGAAALSILTEKDHFGGHPNYLQAVRKAFPQAGILMKDFIVDPYQIKFAKHIGADCVLLIVAVLGDEVAEYLKLVRSLGLHALVEVHDAKELETALRVESTLIGVNNRNLKTMETHLETARQLIGQASPEKTFICESGLSAYEQIEEMNRLGYRGFLIGSHLMKSPSPGAELKRLLGKAP